MPPYMLRALADALHRINTTRSTSQVPYTYRLKSLVPTAPVIVYCWTPFGR